MNKTKSSESWLTISCPYDGPTGSAGPGFPPAPSRPSTRRTGVGVTGRAALVCTVCVCARIVSGVRGEPRGNSRVADNLSCGRKKSVYGYGHGTYAPARPRQVMWARKHRLPHTFTNSGWRGGVVGARCGASPCSSSWADETSTLCGDAAGDVAARLSRTGTGVLYHLTKELFLSVS